MHFDNQSGLLVLIRLLVGLGELSHPRLLGILQYIYYIYILLVSLTHNSPSHGMRKNSTKQVQSEMANNFMK